MPVTNLHRAISSQHGWLNTSRALTAEDLQGRILLLDFWTFCCINCIHVIPDLHYLEEKFADKLTVVGVHSAKFKNEQDSENIRNAILRYGIHHPVVNDFDFSVWKSFGVRAWPTFILINPKGIIEEIYSGEGNRAQIERDVASLIEKYDGRINTQPLPLALEENKQPQSVLQFPGKLAAGKWRDGGKPVDALYVSDSGHHRILAVVSGVIKAVIGSGQPGLKDGNFSEANFNAPQGILYDEAHQRLYVADTGNHVLRLVDFTTQRVSTIAGNGMQGHERYADHKPARGMPLASPWDLAFYPDDNHIAIAMAGTHQLWSYGIEDKTLTLLAGNGNESIDDGGYPFNSLSQPSGLSAYGGKLYFVDSETSSLRVFEKNKITTLIGTGLFDFGYKEGRRGTALMQHALGVFADETGVYIADSYNHSIRRYDPASGVLSNFAGHGVRGGKNGALKEAEFNEPNDLVKIGSKFYIADTNNNAIRMINTLNNEVSTLAVQEAAAVETPEFSNNLPNLDKTEAVTLAEGKPAEVILALSKGWHINDEAPSYLALFAVDEDRPYVLAQFTRDQLKQKTIALPILKKGETYELQGTLYYCEDKAGAQCLLKSFDINVSTAPGGEKQMTLKVN